MIDDRYPPLTMAIVIVTVICSYRAFRHSVFLDWCMFVPLHVLRDKEYHRLFTAGLIHRDWGHLVFNMFCFHAFGAMMETVYGWRTLGIIYLASILGGNLVSLYLHRHHEYRALGASGGVCGVIFAYIFLFPGSDIQMLFIPLDIPAWAFAVAYLLVSFIGLQRAIGDVGHDAHLGGAIVGLLVTTGLHPRIVPASPVLYPVVMGLAVAMFLYTYLRPLYLQPRDAFGVEHARSVGRRWRERRAARRARSDEAAMDRLLDKISRSGTGSLSASEKEQLAAISRRRNGGR